MESIATRDSERIRMTDWTLPDQDFTAKGIHDFILLIGAMAIPRKKYSWTAPNENERNDSVRIERLLTRAMHPRIRRSAENAEHSPSRAESFLHRAQRLDRIGSTDAALDLLYDSVDAMMRGGKFCELDSLLKRLRADDYSLDMLLGILTATLPGRSKLPARGRFLKDAENALRERGEYEDGLLTGLEGFDDGPNPCRGSAIATEC